MNVGKLIKKLKDAGWSQRDVARYCGCEQPLLAYYIRTGNEPKYSLGCKLNELVHLAVTAEISKDALLGITAMKVAATGA